MALPTCNEDMNIIAKLDDEPNDVGGLSATSLKAKFDLAGNLLKKALNDLVAALGNNAAAKDIGFAPTAAVNADNVQDAIENVQSQIAGVSQGGIADGAVTAAKIADGAVGTAAIADDAVTAEKIADGAVDTDAIKWDAVDTYRLKDAAVTEKKLANGAVTESKIGYYAVTEQKIASKAVTGEKIADRTINSAKMGDASVTERALCAGAVTNDKVGYKALVESLPVTASSAAEESAVAVQTCKFVYAKALGVVLFQVTLQGLSSAEIAGGVLLKLSNLRNPPKEFTSCAARVQYAPAQGDYEFTTAPAVLSTAGYLTIRFPSGVVANAKDVIMLSGWYFC